jgi:gamma-glutamyltranspeptidase/glutathione hydrolase
MNPGVAAGHPATAAAGAEVLAAGGNAADAACAAVLAACVAETVMTGFLGGGHAVYWDEGERRAWNLDCFCSVPSGPGGGMVELAVPFGDELVHYAVGPASCAVPGVPAGLDALHARFGSLPWRDVCTPALRIASEDVALPPADAACLAMLAPVMTMDAGAEIYAPGGELLVTGDLLHQPGLVRALEAIAEEGARTAYEGSVARALLELVEERGGVVTRDDLHAYRADWTDPVVVGYCGRTVSTRGGLSGVPSLLAALPRLSALSERERVLAVLPLLEARGVETHTTNVTVVDGGGNACVFTTSLGLGSGDFVPGYDLHLNSMLGEVDLLLEERLPGERMHSMMAPSLVTDGDGVELAIGSAGGTRLRTALALVLAGVLDEELAPQDAVDRPRFHPVGEVVNAEFGVDEAALAELETAGRTVRRWPGRHHYFGGVSAIGRTGAAADPRRSGAVVTV